MKDRLANLNSTLRIYDENAKLFNFSSSVDNNTNPLLLILIGCETVNQLIHFKFLYFKKKKKKKKKKKNIYIILY